MQGHRASCSIGLTEAPAGSAILLLLPVSLHPIVTDNEPALSDVGALDLISMSPLLPDDLDPVLMQTDPFVARNVDDVRLLPLVDLVLLPLSISIKPPVIIQ